MIWFYNRVRFFLSRWKPDWGTGQKTNNPYPVGAKKKNLKTRPIAAWTYSFYFIIGRMVGMFINSFDQVSSSYHCSTPFMKSDGSHYIELCYLIEKNRLDWIELGSDQKNVAHIFPPLFANLLTAHLLELVLEMHQSESKARPNLKHFLICFELYRDLCRTFFNKDCVPFVLMGDLAFKVIQSSLAGRQPILASVCSPIQVFPFWFIDY